MVDLAALSLAWCQSNPQVELTLRQMALLGIVCDEPGPHRVRHLAKRLNVAKPVVTRAANKFTAIGALERKRSTTDKRDLELCATDLGRDLRAALRGDER